MTDRWEPAPVVGGAYSDDARPWSVQDTCNWIPVRAERPGGRSDSMLRTAPGAWVFSIPGPESPVRGAHNVEGRLFVVIGTQLYQVTPSGVAIPCGTIPGTGRVWMAHNQVAGGNQLTIGTGSAGYVYDTRDESQIPVSAGGTGPEPDGDGGSSGGSSGGGSGGTTADRLPASAEPGPNGGYPDNANESLPFPGTAGLPLETELIDAGDFTDAEDADGWSGSSSTPANDHWFVEDGELVYRSAGATAGSTTTYGPARYIVTVQMLPRYIVTVSGYITTVNGATASLGVIKSSASSSSYHRTEPAEYPTKTLVTHTFEWQPRGRLIAGYQSVLADLQGIGPGIGMPWEVRFDDVSMSIEEVPIALTAQTLTNLDFASGLSGWTEDTSTAGFSVVGDALVFTPPSFENNVGRLVNDDLITLAAAAGQCIRVRYKVWCDDPSPRNGGSCGIRTYHGTYTTGPYMRGDWTQREEVVQNMYDGNPPKFVIACRCGTGKEVRVKDIEVDVTDDPVEF